MKKQTSLITYNAQGEPMGKGLRRFLYTTSVDFSLLGAEDQIERLWPSWKKGRRGV